MPGTSSRSGDAVCDLIDRVRSLHLAKGFSALGGEDAYFRVALMVEEIGEICRCLTTGSEGLAEEHADLLITLLGNAVSFDLDIVDAAHRKLDLLEGLEPMVVGGHVRLVTRSRER